MYQLMGVPKLSTAREMMMAVLVGAMRLDKTMSTKDAIALCHKRKSGFEEEDEDDKKNEEK